MTETVIETGRLTLRRIALSDAPFMLELLDDPSFKRHIGDKGVRNLDDARAYIRDGPRASYRRFGFGLFLTELKADCLPIGVCGLLKRTEMDDVDLGYALLPRFWSNGYAIEAARAVLDHARDALDLKRIVAITASANTDSIKVLKRLGMKFERQFRLGSEPTEKMLFGWDSTDPVGAG